MHMRELSPQSMNENSVPIVRPPRPPSSMKLSPRGFGARYDDDKDIRRRLRKRSIPAALRDLAYSTADAQRATTMTTHPTAMPIAALRGNAAAVLFPEDESVRVAMVVEAAASLVTSGGAVSSTLLVGVAVLTNREVGEVDEPVDTSSVPLSP